jgi:hypothetical protein
MVELDRPKFHIEDRRRTDQCHSTCSKAISQLIDEAVAMGWRREEVALQVPEKGHGLHNANGDGIEQFGHVDGRGQPLFLMKDIDDEKLRSDGASNRGPGFGPDRAIVSDTAAPGPTFHQYLTWIIILVSPKPSGRLS